jgi:hypothetical protein
VGGTLWATKAMLSSGEQQHIKKYYELLAWFNEQRTAANDKFVK